MGARRVLGRRPVRRRCLPRGKNRWGALAGIVALVAGCAGCGSVADTSAPPPLGHAAYGPILDMVTSQLQVNGRPRAVTQYFPVRVRRVYATVFLGDLHGATQMTMTWSRLTSHGLQQLFTKQVPVTSYGLAYTAGQTQGTLPLGTYQVSASVGGTTRSIQWSVYTPTGTTAADFARTASALRPGGSGLNLQPIPRMACQEVLSTISMPSTTTVRLMMSAYCPQDQRTGATRGALIATMDRNAGMWLIGSMHLTHSGELTGSFSLDVCKLPGGSNHPGQTLFYSSVVYYNGQPRNFTGSYVLPPAHQTPLVSISSSVPAGTRVQPGEKIVLHVTAAEPARLGPEAPIRSITVAGPGGAVVKFRRFHKAPQGCDQAWLSRTVQFTYTVPAGAPKTLTLTASAIGAAGRSGMATISFPASA
jgi:hypothetical protein